MAALRVGILGLGRVSGKILGAFPHVGGVELAGAADIRVEARNAFATRFRLPVFETVQALCAADTIDAVRVATPNQLHRDHVVALARAGKHIICEKPMATSLAECDAMIEAADVNGVKLLMVSKVLETPIRAIRDLVESGRIGDVFQVSTLVYTDWLQRPRLAEELDPELGGGIVFRQAPHAIDIQRYIAGRPVESVRAVAGRGDPGFDAEGHFSALLVYAGGGAGMVTLNGYGYFDGAELTYGIGESGLRRPLAVTRKPHRRSTGAVTEQEKFRTEPAGKADGEHAQPFYGLTVVSGASGVIRQSERGLLVFDAGGCTGIELPLAPRCAAELIELRDAVKQNRAVFPDGRWGRDTLDIVTRMWRSSLEGREVSMAPASDERVRVVRRETERVTWRN
jgi:phthalate 4,5-cis-dihydrodiol dehydrogenase